MSSSISSSSSSSCWMSINCSTEDESAVSSSISHESSSIAFDWKFEQDWFWQLVHLVLQPFLQLQKIVFRSFSGAGGRIVWIGSKILSINFQSQSAGFSCVAALDNKYRYTTLSNGHGSEVVSALGFERSGPGFDSRRPWSYYSTTHQNKE